MRPRRDPPDPPFHRPSGNVYELALQRHLRAERLAANGPLTAQARRSFEAGWRAMVAVAERVMLNRKAAAKEPCR